MDSGVENFWETDTRGRANVSANKLTGVELQNL
jgi:hypothetical protein